MKLIKPSYEILNEKDLFRVSKEIEQAARTCYKSEDKTEPGSDAILIKKLIDSGHEAMLEFGPSIVVRFICDRGVSHELVRHRLCDFAQESTRYCNYSKNKYDNQITFIIPSWLSNIPEGDYDERVINENGEFFSPTIPNILFDWHINYWLHSIYNIERSYLYLVKELNWQPQQARSVLPNSLKTEIVIKANVREWRHIFIQRCSSKAHPQIRELMVPLLNHFINFCPLLFDDIKLKITINKM